MTIRHQTYLKCPDKWNEMVPPPPILYVTLPAGSGTMIKSKYTIMYHNSILGIETNSVYTNTFINQLRKRE